ncbi:MAG: PASTA domain-containing protein [Proteobacteria bacterium]|nr:PASTA domain-containing protein [Pseudomonadota bacterium]
MLAAKAARGHVVTFYSFKGGTGRTMALANSACVLAEAQKDGANAVLVVDWDLEAPGLHRYFPPRLRSADPGASLGLDDQPGLIDLMHALMEALPESEPESEELARLAAERALGSIELERFICPTDVPGVSILRAGRNDDSGYSKRVNTFDWEALFNRCPLIYRALAEELAARFRWVLIDSRTGLTDISGICTALMPEKLVVVFTPNLQSLSGVRDIVQRAVSHRLDGGDPRPLLVYPLASRIETSLERLSRDWRRGKPDMGLVGYQPMFEQLLAECNGLPQCSLEAYFDTVFIQQTPDWAYGEVIAVRDGSNDRLSLSQSYRVFIERLMSGQSPWAAPQALGSAPGVASQPAAAKSDLHAPSSAATAAANGALAPPFSAASPADGDDLRPASAAPEFAPAADVSASDGVRVFASFAQADTPRVLPLLEALTSFGLEVSSEGNIGVGQSYTQVVTRLVDAADVVVVFWSRESVQSQAVEAQVIEGLRRGRLLPVLLDDALPPLAFRHVQALSLRGPVGAGIKELVEAVHRLARVRPGDAVPQALPSSPTWESSAAAPSTGMATTAPGRRRLLPVLAGTAVFVAALVAWIFAWKPAADLPAPPVPAAPASAPLAAPTLVTVPDLVNLDTAAAATTANALGLNLALVDAHSGAQQAGLSGIVTAQEPVAKSLAPAGSTLKLTVTTDIVIVPQLVGRTIGSAFDTLGSVGLRLGATVPVEGSKLTPGTIISQDPAAGTRAAGGVRISVRVAASVKSREPLPSVYDKGAPRTDKAKGS